MPICLSNEFTAHISRLASTARSMSEIPSDQHILCQYICKSPVNRCANVVELGNEGVFKPVDSHLGEDDEDDWLMD